MSKAYEFLKSQGMRCLMLINVRVNFKDKTIKACIAFFPARLPASIWVSHQKEKYLIEIPKELQNKPMSARKLHWKTNYLDAKL